MIIKCEKRRDFTIISNEAARDGRLSFKARGLLVYMIGLPPDWDIYEKELCQHTTDGKDSIHSAMEELIKAGYVYKVQGKNRAETKYYISDEPKERLEWAALTGNAIAENPQSPIAENPQSPIAENPQSHCGKPAMTIAENPQ